MVKEPRSRGDSEEQHEGSEVTTIPTVPGARTRSFLLRFWAEAREVPGARQRVRGRVTHLVTGEECFFADAQSLLTWLERILKEEFGEVLVREGNRGGSGRGAGDEGEEGA